MFHDEFWEPITLSTLIQVIDRVGLLSLSVIVTVTFYLATCIVLLNYRNDHALLRFTMCYVTRLSVWA